MMKQPRNFTVNTVIAMFEPMNSWVNQFLAGLRNTDSMKVTALASALRIEYPNESEEFLHTSAKKLLDGQIDHVSRLYDRDR
jgi:hypothetical protein